MNIQISFSKLPFSPDYKQVIYVENTYDERLNRLIQENYASLTEGFKEERLEFIYLPCLNQLNGIYDKVRYYAPYLNESTLDRFSLESSSLLKFMAHQENREKIERCFLFYPVTFGKSEAGRECKYNGIILEEEQLNAETFTSSIVKAIASRIRNLREKESWPEFSIVSEPSIEYSETQKALKEVQAELENAVRKLRLNGVSLYAIHEIIDKQEPLSKLTVTSDYRIILPDYNNMEIKMTMLPKALYLLFLKHPEGIQLKLLQDYADELKDIYRKLKPSTGESKLTASIAKMVNPIDNDINVNIARIRKAFVEQFDEHLAKNYYITGERGGQYLIPLDRNLIEWQE